MRIPLPSSRQPKNITLRHFQPGLPAVTLEITRGGIRNPVRQVCRTTYFIGRGRDCDLVVNDPRFAEVHALLLITASGVTIRHLGNEPGLIVDGRSAGHVTLADQTVFSMGQFEFLIHTRPPIAAILDPSASLDSVARMLETLVLSEHGDTAAAEGSRRPAPAGKRSSVDIEASVGIPKAVQPPVWRHMSRRHVPVKAA